MNKPSCKLLIVFLLFALRAFGQASFNVVTLPYKADGLNFFTGNGATLFNVTLTGNVNTSGLNGGSRGMTVAFNICQDAFGGRTFNWPPNVTNPPVILSGANACTTATFINNGDNLTWIYTGTGTAGVQLGANNTFTGNNSFPNLVTPTIGLSLSQQHTIPAVASDTFALLAATQTFSGPKTFSQQITSTVATGTAPFSIASTTVVPNLNSQLHGGLTAPGSAIVGISDTQTLTNKTITNPTVTNPTVTTGAFSSPALTTPSIGGDTVSAGPRALWFAFAPAMTATGGISQFTPDKAITITSIFYAVPPGSVTGSGCTTQPVVNVFNGTAATVTLVNGNSQGGTTGLSVNMAAGGATQIQIATAASGCGSNWTNVNVIVQYKMQ